MIKTGGVSTLSKKPYPLGVKVIVRGNLLPNIFMCALGISLILHPTKADAYVNADIAEAIAYSGCTGGLVLNPNQFGMNVTVNSLISLGLSYRIIDEGRATEVIEQRDTTEGRSSHEHILQAWATAGALSSKWKALESTYEKGISVGIKRWISGATLGVSTRAAESTASPKLSALCRIAEIAVLSKSKKSKMPLRQYILKTSGNYLPALP